MYLKKTALRKHKIINDLKKSNKKDIIQKVAELNYLNNNEKAFCKLLLKRKCLYTPSDKFIAQNIFYYRSPSIYRSYQRIVKN